VYALLLEQEGSYKRAYYCYMRLPCAAAFHLWIESAESALVSPA
jgi:hypothetical protein